MVCPSGDVVKSSKIVRVAIRVLNGNLRLDPVFRCKVKWGRHEATQVMTCTDAKAGDPASETILNILMKRDTIW